MHQELSFLYAWCNKQEFSGEIQEEELHDEKGKLHNAQYCIFNFSCVNGQKRAALEKYSGPVERKRIKFAIESTCYTVFNLVSTWYTVL